MNVLILTDFSEVSDNAAKYAIDFLQEIPSNFYLLNIQDFNFNRTASNKLEHQLIDILEKLQKNAEELKYYSSNPEHHFNTSLSSENLIKAVRLAMEERKIDLIFIGTVSQKTHQHPILGDHAYDVVRKIKCNIIAVPAGCQYKIPKNTIFPVDSSLIPDEKIVQIMEESFYLKKTKFSLMEINDTKVIARNPEGQEKNVIRFKDLNYNFLEDIREKFDFIFIIGKNLNICDRFLHTRYGFSAKMVIKIPIFVYHQ
ncbi:universal stress protein [Christiangramia sp.]|uniref:universal stress protein n=1 Tax=Christiangramia sp. TaxID=1931228 RepID=UPI002609DDDE|nr:universal stress protein [Christiangramia sp.]